MIYHLSPLCMGAGPSERRDLIPTRSLLPSPVPVSLSLAALAEQRPRLCSSPTPSRRRGAGLRSPGRGGMARASLRCTCRQRSETSTGSASTANRWLTASSGGSSLHGKHIWIPPLPPTDDPALFAPHFGVIASLLYISARPPTAHPKWLRQWPYTRFLGARGSHSTKAILPYTPVHPSLAAHRSAHRTKPRSLSFWGRLSSLLSAPP